MTWWKSARQWAVPCCPGAGAKPKIDNAGEVTPGITLAERGPIIDTIDRVPSRVDLTADVRDG